MNGRELRGLADLITKVAYEPENGSFVLHDARLLRLDISNVKPKLLDLAKDAANRLASEQVSGIPIYKLRRTDVKQAVARLVLESVTVRDGVLRVDIGL